MTVKKDAKNYLSRGERDNWLLAMTTIHHIENIIKTWGGNLTSDESRRLKTSITNTEKALSSITRRMPAQEAKKLMKHASNFEVRILSVEGARALERNTMKKFEKNIPFDLTDLTFLSSYILESSCYNCTREFNDCHFHKIFEKWLTPGANSLSNCPFAYNSTCELNCNKPGEEVIYERLQTYGKLKDREQKIIEKFNDGELIYKKDIGKYLSEKENKTKEDAGSKKISKRKKKKLENRFDEEDNDYVYETK